MLLMVTQANARDPSAGAPCERARIDSASVSSHSDSCEEKPAPKV